MGDQTIVCCCSVRPARDAELGQNIMLSSRGAPGSALPVDPDDFSSKRSTGEVEMKMYGGASGAGGQYASLMSSVMSEKTGSLSPTTGRVVRDIRDGGGRRVLDERASVPQPSLTETSQRRALEMIDQMNHRQDTSMFVRVSFWQNTTIYIIYFVILINLFIVTFGISGR